MADADLTCFPSLQREFLHGEMKRKGKGRGKSRQTIWTYRGTTSPGARLTRKVPYRRIRNEAGSKEEDGPVTFEFRPERNKPQG